MSFRASNLTGANASSPPPMNDSSRRLSWLCGVLVAVVAAWNAKAVVGFDFVWFDDDINIVFNPHLGPPGVDMVRWMFSDAEYMRRYVPLGWLSLSIVYWMSGLSPAGYHAANLVLHAVNAVLMFGVLSALLERYRAAADGRWRVAAATMGAALWALHPMKAETVGWASGLLYAVSGCFALSSVLVYLSAGMSGTSVQRRVRVLAAAMLYGCSLLAYPMSLGLIAVFVLLDVGDWRHGTPGMNWQRLGVEKMLLAAPAVFSAGASLLAGYGAPEYWPRPANLSEFGVVPRVQQVFEAARYYLWRPWWPAGLTPAPTRLFELEVLSSVWSAMIVIGVTVLLTCRPNWRRGALLLWVAHLALLAPLLGAMDRPYFPADRYHYLASAAVVAAIVLLGAAVREHFSRAAFGCVLVMVGLGLGVLQREQIEVWRNTDTLLRRIVDQATAPVFKQRTYWRWAQFHLNHGNIGAAEQMLAAASIRETNLGVLVRAHASIEEMKTGAMDRVPVAARLHHEIARDFSRRNHAREAEDHFRAALQIAPNYREAAYNFSTLLAVVGRGDEALHLYLGRIAPAPIEHVPQQARTRLLSTIAEAFHISGHPERALRVIEHASAPTTMNPALEIQRERFRNAVSSPKTVSGKRN